MARPASARRYAQAVFEIAREKKTFDRWRSDLKVIAQAVSQPQLFAVLESPKVHFQDKAKLLSQTLKGIDPLALNLAYLLTTRNILSIAPQIAEEYEHMLDAYHNIRHAVVTTAVALKHEEQEHLSHRLSGLLGGKVMIENRVDPEIIGGLVARIDDKLLDGSTRSRLEALKKDLAEARTGG